MGNSYAAYLVNKEARKHHFVAALFDNSRNKWVVVMAWGHTGTVHKESVYDKDFTGEKNAVGYAKAIVNAKLGEGFDLHDNDEDIEGDVPEWWDDISSGSSDKLGKIDTAQNKGRGKWSPKTVTPKPPPAATAGDEDEGAARAKKERDINELKEKMAAKVKIEAGKAKIAVKQQPKDEDEEEKRAAPRPRFGYAPRK